jgi:CheY-like chemotaxis protein
MPYRILVADDDPILREIATEHLSRAGYAVTLAEDGRKALRAAQAGAFDVILTDMVMPNLDGVELLQALRVALPATPVLAMSAGFHGCDAGILLQAARSIGAVAVLRKPLDRQALLDAVGAALRKPATA